MLKINSNIVSELIRELITCNKREVSQIIQNLLNINERFCYHLICYFLEMFHKTGILKPLNKRDFGQHLAIKKSRLNALIQKARSLNIAQKVENELVLNIDNNLVERLIAYYFNTNKNFTNEIISLIAEIEITSKKIEKLNEEIGDPENENNLLAFTNEVESIFEIKGNRSDIFELCKNSVSILINIKANN